MQEGKGCRERLSRISDRRAYSAGRAFAQHFAAAFMTAAANLSAVHATALPRRATALVWISWPASKLLVFAAIA
jgi:hypothetical protein